jgi:GT2 family glycosyltransferase
LAADGDGKPGWSANGAAAAQPALAEVGVVAIGRNEGDRLRRCLASLPKGAAAAVYVDSASTDGSVAFARDLGVQVVELDMSVPFTAARARNAGIARLREVAPAVRFVQVLDGDCELIDGFVADALAAMASDPAIAAVCGRRREIHPEASVYNRLADMEWATLVGEVAACGGDALIRLAAFDAVGGYDAALIAGEEPEMCLRMRHAGYKILRIDRDMTRHDAAITRFGQWWKRNVRAGHACAEGAHRHPDDAFSRHTLRSNMIWGFVVPAAGLHVLYGVLWWRSRRHRMRRHGDSPRDASVYATYCVLGKLPQFLGAVQFHGNRLRGRRSRIIEYKAG